jgi:hypothetical protein
LRRHGWPSPDTHACAFGRVFAPRAPSPPSASDPAPYTVDHLRSTLPHMQSPSSTGRIQPPSPPCRGLEGKNCGHPASRRRRRRRIPYIVTVTTFPSISPSHLAPQKNKNKIKTKRELTHRRRPARIPTRPRAVVRPLALRLALLRKTRSVRVGRYMRYKGDMREKDGSRKCGRGCGSTNPQVRVNRREASVLPLIEADPPKTRSQKNQNQNAM